MPQAQNETLLIRRYIGSGMLNTAVGFAAIFLLMWLGASPFIANICGYVVGLTLGFFVSRNLVFRSKGHLNIESLRYFAAFLCCFLLNLLVLHIAIESLNWSPNLAQLIAAATYTLAMYPLTRYVVFQVES